MFLFFPIYKFDIVTRCSPGLVRARIGSLIKKIPDNKKGFEIHFTGEDWGTEEFSGIVEENYFKIKRYEYVSRDSKIIIYEGNIEPTQHGSIVHVTFRYDFFVMFLMIIFLSGFVVGVIGLFNNNIGQSIDSIGFILSSLFIYSIFMIGFNYRSNKVRTLLEKKLVR
ncbi:MAG TPA: hypothetical protein VF941_11430 [Clostridia bacterium]